ncbi:hypothetical protein HBI95_093570 [Parastagonospora nodorum]|nr:hypothetical protein HBI95_093570 [Parastagonospora nodorum]KAH5472955.1 hypothetical protein HBI28_132520 [Parastagonospora nodorum]KAH5627605.1 hypothetical protein HBI22_141230 [Parastagonospora nodorum]
MKIFSRIKELFSRERRHREPYSMATSSNTTCAPYSQGPDQSKKRGKISSKLRSLRHNIKGIDVERTVVYHEPPAYTSATTTNRANCLLHVDIEPTSTWNFGDFDLGFDCEIDYSIPDSHSVTTPVSLQQSILPASSVTPPRALVTPLATSHVSMPSTLSNTSPSSSRSVVSKSLSLDTSQSQSTILIDSGESGKSSLTHIDDAEVVPPTVIDILVGEASVHNSSKKQDSVSVVPEGVSRSCDLEMTEHEDGVGHISSDTTSVKVEDSNSDDEEDREPLHRHDWDTIHKIPDLHFKQLILSTISRADSGATTINDCSVNARNDGGFNHIVYMTMLHNNTVQHLIVRVPAIGTFARWQNGDAHNMRCEMALLAHLRKTTSIPVPEVLAFSDNLDTPIGAPFCIMKQLPGKPAHRIWFQDPANRNHVTANAVTVANETKRCNTLRSLAHFMAQLATLTFDKIGTPDLINPSCGEEPHNVTHSYRWKNAYQVTASDLENEGQIYQYGPFENSEEYMISTLEESWPLTPDADFDPDDKDDQDTWNSCYGIRRILDLIYVQPAIAFSLQDPDDIFEPESFVLRHPDLDFQNILVNDDGYVTGIIDWESCMAVPRCVGYASVPDFLRRDWSKGHSLRDSPHMTWRLQHYRQVYADAMRETGAPEAKYTLKSAMYRAAVEAVNDGSPTDLIKKIFVHIPGLCMTDVDEFQQFIGEGWPEALNYLGQELNTLFKPVAF